MSLVLLAPYGALSDTRVEDYMAPETDINNRLAKLEVVLESVLVKNAELESRIERLEEENRRLKESAPYVEEAENPHGAVDHDNVGEN